MTGVDEAPTRDGAGGSWQERLRTGGPFLAVIALALAVGLVPGRGGSVEAPTLALGSQEAAVAPVQAPPLPPPTTPQEVAAAQDSGDLTAGEAPAGLPPIEPAAPSGSTPSFEAGPGLTDAPPVQSASGSDAPAATGEPARPSDAGATQQPNGLRVTAAGWAQSSVPPVVGQPAVPDGELPVAATGGQDRRRSFLRLAGSGKDLSLKLGAPAGQSSTSAGGVRACVITTKDWKAQPGQNFAEAPGFDDTRCVPGVSGGEGDIAFDLAPLGEVTKLPGLAVVPDPAAGATATFQVTFTRPAGA